MYRRSGYAPGIPTEENETNKHKQNSHSTIPSLNKGNLENKHMQEGIRLEFP
jgi:hypothetical protein